MSVRILIGDCLEQMRLLPDGSVNCCVTSPPYWGLRDYGHSAQIGREESPAVYVQRMVAVFAEVHRLLTLDGTLWLNLGDSYAGGGCGSRDPIKWPKQSRNDHMPVHAKKKSGLPAKNLLGIPWRVAFALQDAGWILREDIIWSKPNCMPESVTDRCTRSHEYIFHLSKSADYFHDGDAIKEPAIYEIENSHGSTTAGKARAQEDHKSFPNGERNGIRPVRFKDARDFAGKHEDKQRSHSRRHNGSNDRWDKMEKSEQCSGMRNKRSVWTVSPANYAEAHFATFPPALIRPCILAGCPVGGTVLDPFAGSGTTGEVSEMEGRNSVLIELNPAYAELAKKRTEQSGLFA